MNARTVLLSARDDGLSIIASTVSGIPWLERRERAELWRRHHRRGRKLLEALRRRSAGEGDDRVSPRAPHSRLTPSRSQQWSPHLRVRRVIEFASLRAFLGGHERRVAPDSSPDPDAVRPIGPAGHLVVIARRPSRCTRDSRSRDSAHLGPPVMCLHNRRGATAWHRRHTFMSPHASSPRMAGVDRPTTLTHISIVYAHAYPPCMAARSGAGWLSPRRIYRRLAWRKRRAR